MSLRLLILLLIMTAAGLALSRVLNIQDIQAYDQGLPHNCTTIREYPQCGIDDARCSRYYALFPERRFPCINGCQGYFFWIEQKVCDDIDGYLYRCGYQPQNDYQCTEGGGGPPPPGDFTGDGTSPPPPYQVPQVGDFDMFPPISYCNAPNQPYVDISWEEAPGADYYKVFRCDSAGANCASIQNGHAVCAGSATHTYTDPVDNGPGNSSPAQSTTYQYYIEGIPTVDGACTSDAAFNKKNQSRQKYQVSTPNCVAPPTVDVKARKGNPAPEPYSARKDYKQGFIPPALEINSGTEALITWTTTNNPTYCEGSEGTGGWVGPKPNSNTTGFATGPLYGPDVIIYPLTCYNAKGESARDYVQINVLPPDSLTPWLQTQSGDVHSNTRINAPGGP